VNIVHLYWEYDHDVDPFDLGKICILFCSDDLYTAKLAVSSVTYKDKKSVAVSETTSSLCGEERAGLGYTAVKSGEWRLFYKNCNGKK